MVLIRDNRNTNSYSENNDSDEQEQDSEKSCHPGTNKKDEEHKEQTRTTSQGTNANIEDNITVFLQTLILASNRLWQLIKRISLFVMVDLGGYQLFDRVAQWCVQHPQMAICVLAAGLVAILPILLFSTFALTTIVMTFTGFLVLEGTLLTILTMIMFGLLGALAVVLLFFALVGVATYFGVSHVYDMYGSTELQRNVLRNFMERDNRNCSNNTNIARNTNQSSQNENIVN